MKKTYSGSCHCGQVKFEADIDFAEGTDIYWARQQGGNELTEYHFKSDDSAFAWKRGASEFCKHCGIRPFGRGDVPEIGGAFVSVNIAALDDVDVSEFFQGPIRYADGRHDNWQNTPVETRHL